MQAAHGHLEGECKKQEQELRKLAEQLARTVAERNEVESQLRSTKGQVAFLQGELTALSRDKDSLKGQIKDHDARVVALQHELEQASSSVSNSIKRLEEKFEEEKRAALEALTKEKAGLMQQLGEQQEQVKVLTERCKQLQERTMKVLSALHGDMERSAQPMFMFAVRPSAAVKMAEQLVPGYEKITNFKLDERVAQFLAPHYEMTLTLISQLYVARILKDCKQEEFLLGGQVGPRSALEPVIYDFFCHHFGSRQATDLHLTAFLAAVLKFKGQHPKIRVFARLLGVGEEPVPRRAADFYLALLNRIHSRAGPLVAEAAEGYSQVKCRIVSKAARELLRGSFANINDDAANLSDTLRHMAMNDEEKHIDLEVSCEMTLNAWLTQVRRRHDPGECKFKLDADALARDLRSFAANKDLTPDDLLQFLHQLDPARAATLEPSHITSMFRSAVRAVGPTPSAAEFVQQLCEAILDAGFVGMSGYQSRLEPVKAAPPFDDFRLLDECWRGLRAVIEAQLSVLDSHRELKADVRSYIDLGKRLDLQMELRESATVAWAMYRKLVNLYLHYRKPAEQILAFVPLAQPGLLGLRPVALSEDQALAQAEEAALAAKAAAEAEADISRKPARARAVTKTNSFGSGLTYEFNKAAVTPDTKKGGRLAPGPPPP
ncbi:hypothetical protein QJQ45_007653 [Haematococcus lacustris]|nr:hypothetical protein QJQ45_007653 [Haematococcus lacustris]